MPYIFMMKICREGEPKRCSACKKTKPDGEFYRKKNRDVNGNRYSVRFKRCKKCENKKRVENLLNNRPKFLYRSYKGWDRRKNFRFDLTEEFIRDAISNPCSYCHAEDISMGLDRVDPSRGHEKDNVLPACIRCNSIRMDMPFAAWGEIIPAIKRAHEMGLFGNWNGRNSSIGKYPIR